MNYMITRYIIMIILILIFVLYVKFFKKKVNDERKYKNIKLYKIILIYLFIWLIMNAIPFENYFIKFKTIEDNINYFFTNPEIKKKFVYEDYVYVKLVYKEIGGNKVNCFMYLEKNNGSWELSNLLNRNQGYNHKTIDFHRFQIIELEDRNSLAIEITSAIDGNKIEISDSLNSKVYFIEDNGFQHSFIIINKKIDKENYKIFINDKTYYPMK